MTRTTPARLTTLHFWQIGLTLALTFISLLPVGDASPREVVRGQLDLDLVARQDLDVVHAHLAGDVREHDLPGGDLHAEHRVRERLQDAAFDFDLLFFGHG